MVHLTNKEGEFSYYLLDMCHSSLKHSV